MEPNRKVDRVLDDWNAVSATARRPAKAPRGSGGRGAWSGLGLAGAGLLAAGLVLAIAWLGQRPTTGVGATGPSSTPAASAVAIAPTPSASLNAGASHEAAPTASPSPKKDPTPKPTATPMPDCTPSDLSARIVSWEGAAGSRIATVDLTVAGPAPCRLATLNPVRLIDGTGRILAGPAQPGGGSTLTVQPGEKLSTLVDASNVCGAPPAPPVTLEFEIQASHWLRANPVSPTDATVPPCNGPNQPSEIQMHDWAKA
jgi:hypothetical protein